jgi:biopolymer transport protein ExbB
MILYLMQGGPVLIAILLVSIMGGTLVILQCMRLRQASENHSKPLQELARLARNCDWFESLRVAEKHNHPFLTPWREGFSLLLEGKSDFQDVEETVSVEGQQLVNHLESALKPLGALTTILPMLGFLGTILGLMVSFQAWEQMGTQITISALAGGINQAMITTAAGLATAIPYYLLYHLLATWTSRVALNFSRETTQLFRWIKQGLAKRSSPLSEELFETST